MQKFRKPQKATVYYRLYNTKNGGISHEHHYRHRPRLLRHQNSPLLVPGWAYQLRRTRTLHPPRTLRVWRVHCPCVPQHVGMYPFRNGCADVPCRFSIFLYKCRNRIRRHRPLRATISIEHIVVSFSVFCRMEFFQVTAKVLRCFRQNRNNPCLDSLTCEIDTR